MTADDDALLEAASAGDTDRVIALLDAGADVGHTNEYGFDALASALWGSHLDTALLLVDRGAEVGIDASACLGRVAALEAEWPAATAETRPVTETITEMIGPYLGACRTGQVEVIDWFLGRGVPVDLHPPGDEWGGIGCPGLHHAVENGHVDAVMALLAAGADVTLVDDVYRSGALAWAAGGGHGAIVELLLAAGADPGHTNVHGCTAAALARDHGQPELADRLESAG